MCNLWSKDIQVYIFLTPHSSDQRFIAHNGLLNFWGPIADSVAYRKDHLVDIPAPQSYITDLCKRNKPLKRVICSCCGSHLGQVYDDGPYPFYKRFTVNCASLDFKIKEYWEAPVPRDPMPIRYKGRIGEIIRKKDEIINKLNTMLKVVDLKRAKSTHNQ